MKKLIFMTFILVISTLSYAKPQPKKSQCIVRGQKESHLIVISEIKNNKAKVEYSSSADADVNFGTLEADNSYIADVKENVKEVIQVIENKNVKKYIVKNEIELYNQSAAEKTTAKKSKLNSEELVDDVVEGTENKQQIAFLEASINKVTYKGTAKFKLQSLDREFNLICEPFVENVF